MCSKEDGCKKHREIHDVEQSKKMVPFITRETTFGQHVRKLVLGVNKYDLDFGWSKLILSNEHERESVGLDTYLIVGRLPLMIILITASLSSKIDN